MAENAGIGVTIESGDIAFLFGEDQARYLAAVRPSDIAALTAAAGAADVTLAQVGRFGGAAVTLGAASAPVAELSKIYRSAFAAAVA